MTDRICVRCLDAVIYCTCYLGEDRELTSSGEFRITDGKDELVWNPSNRMLSGNERLKKAILAELSDQKETIYDVGTLWMEQREPMAVAFVADRLGYVLIGDYPKWGYFRD